MALLSPSGASLDALTGGLSPAWVDLLGSGLAANAGSARFIRAAFAGVTIASGAKATFVFNTTAARASSKVLAAIVLYDGTPITHGIPAITLAAATAGAVAVEVANFGANSTGARTFQIAVQVFD